jgi:hypothetical protein
MFMVQIDVGKGQSLARLLATLIPLSRSRASALTGASFSLSGTSDCQSLSFRHCRLRDDEVAVIVVVDVSLCAHFPSST